MRHHAARVESDGEVYLYFPGAVPRDLTKVGEEGGNERAREPASEHTVILSSRETDGGRQRSSWTESENAHSVFLLLLLSLSLFSIPVSQCHARTFRTFREGRRRAREEQSQKAR